MLAEYIMLWFVPANNSATVNAQKNFIKKFWREEILVAKFGRRWVGTYEMLYWLFKAQWLL
jgi:hypothetical protein